MTYPEIKKLCRRGKVGMIPQWKGYIKWNYAKDQLEFVNGNYVMCQEELEKKIGNRTDLFYII